MMNFPLIRFIRRIKLLRETRFTSFTSETLNLNSPFVLTLMFKFIFDTHTLNRLYEMCLFVGKFFLFFATPLLAPFDLESTRKLETCSVRV